MKIAYFVVFLVLFTALLSAQKVQKTIDHDGITRHYIEYVPGIYDASQPVPIIICLHGLGDTISNFSNIGMHQISDTANFIVITPQALNATLMGYNFGAAWNSGASSMGFVLNQTVDDLGFIQALIDTTATLYNIDHSKIFATGFSMGGFMCHRLACELNTTVAAIASVSGTMGAALTCAPDTAISVLHIHGTADGTVAYTGNSYGNDAEEVVEYWRSLNNCDTVPVVDSIPDIQSDGKTVVKYSYKNGNAGTEVDFFKVEGGDHEWLYYPVNDIDYAIEIWKFFCKSINAPNRVEKIEKNTFDVNVFPNPADEQINIAINNCDGKDYLVKLYNYLGVEVMSLSGENSDNISTSKLEPGMYYLNVSNSKNTITKKVLILH